jgi:hypothetical protein
VRYFLIIYLKFKVSNQKAKFVAREHEIYHRIVHYVIVFDVAGDFNHTIARAVWANMKSRSCCIDRAIARRLQQDRGLIFSRHPELRSTSRTMPYNKKTYCVKTKKKRGHAKYKVWNIREVYKFISWLVKLLYGTFYRILTEFWIVFQEIGEVYSLI